MRWELVQWHDFALRWKRRILRCHSSRHSITIDRCVTVNPPWPPPSLSWPRIKYDLKIDIFLIVHHRSSSFNSFEINTTMRSNFWEDWCWQIFVYIRISYNLKLLKTLLFFKSRYFFLSRIEILINLNFRNSSNTSK